MQILLLLMFLVNTAVLVTVTPSKSSAQQHHTASAPLKDRLASPAGEVRVTERVLTVGGRTVLAADGGFWGPVPNLQAAVPAGSPAVVLVQFPGGTACEATYRLLDLTSSPPTVTAEFGTCSDLASLAWTGRFATVSMPGRRGPGRWTYQPGTNGRPGSLTEERRR